MTISSTVNRVSFSGNGVTTAFSFPYYFLASADLVVVERNNSTGVETTKTLTTHYTVTGAGVQSGGTVTMLVAPASGTSLIIYRDPATTQDLDLVENDPMPAEEIEKRFDKAAMWGQRNKERLDRAVTMTDGNNQTFDPKLPALITADRAIVTNDTATGFVMGPTVTDIADAQANAAAAAASAAAASASEDNAATSAAASAASATASQAAANSTMWQDVVFITSADSPLTLNDTYSGVMLACDCSSGSIVINLPSIAGLTFELPWVVGIKKTDSSGNSITVNRNGADTIDGLTSKTISTANSGSIFIPDMTPSPDTWTTAEFGASAGNLSVDRFSGTGAQTAFTLSVQPASENNTWVYIGGVYQQKDTYSISGTTLTFSEAPLSGTDNVEVVSGTLLSVGTPSDGTITNTKVASGAGIEMSKTNFAIAYLKDVRSAGTNGGTYTVGSWETRTLNTEEDPDSIVSLAANQFTLQAGTYEVAAKMMNFDISRVKGRLRNITDSSDAIVGMSHFSVNSAASESVAVVEGVITIASAKVFELQIRGEETSTGTYGHGLAANLGVSEVFTSLKITRIK
jgi:hypothetical protein